MTQSTDIKQNAFVLQRSPKALRPYILLSRLDRPIGIYLLLLPALWAFALGYNPEIPALKLAYFLLLFTVGAVIMRAAGCVVNDLIDQELDKKVERTKMRPLASGDLSPKHAFYFLGGLLTGGFLILIQLPFQSIVLGLVSLPLIGIYPLMKRYTWMPQLFLGLTFNFSVLIAWTSLGHSLNLDIMTLYISCILWTIVYDTVYAHQDIEDDALIGIKSTARLFADKSKIYVSGLYLGSWLLTTYATKATLNDLHSIIFMVPAGLFAVYRTYIWDPANNQSSLNGFKSAHHYGVLVLLGIVSARIYGF